MSGFTNEFLPVPLDFTKPGPASYAPNVVNYNWYVYKVQGGNLSPVTSTPVYVQPIPTS
jgi:hypothetical protein